MTNPEKILNYLSIARGGEWVREGEIRGIQTAWGFIGYRGDRDVRDLIKSGAVESKMDGKFRVVRRRLSKIEPKNWSKENEFRVELPPAFKSKEAKKQTTLF